MSDCVKHVTQKFVQSMNIIYISIFHVALSFLQSVDIPVVLSLSGIPEPVNKRVKALFYASGLVPERDRGYTVPDRQRTFTQIHDIHQTEEYTDGQLPEL